MIDDPNSLSIGDRITYLTKTINVSGTVATTNPLTVRWDDLGVLEHGEQDAIWRYCTVTE